MKKKTLDKKLAARIKAARLKSEALLTEVKQISTTRIGHSFKARHTDRYRRNPY